MLKELLANLLILNIRLGHYRLKCHLSFRLLGCQNAHYNIKYLYFII